MNSKIMANITAWSSRWQDLVSRTSTAPATDFMKRDDLSGAASRSAAEFFLEFSAGLVLMMDKQGLVCASGGRDKADFMRWMPEPEGRGFMDGIHVSDRIGFFQALDRLRQGEASARVDLRFKRLIQDQGQFAHLAVDLTLCSECDAAGDVLVQVRDVSVEHALRNDVEAQAERADQAHDLKTRFLAATSHELRTPLNAILGFSDVLLADYFGRIENERHREYLALVRESGAHLLSVVNRMLDMSRIEAGHYELQCEPFDVGALVQACEAMLGIQAKAKGVTLASRVQRGLGHIIADRGAVQQILINLVGNAIKFTPKGGAVSVDATVRNGIFTLTVSDTGMGIAPDKLAQLGQPFVQVDRARSGCASEGTGLGLSLVKGMVALHGGDFTMTSQPGKGTVVTVSMIADGSGRLVNGETARTEQMEFPPRLVSKLALKSVSSEEGLYGHAKAQVA